MKMLQLGNLGAGHLPIFFAIAFTVTLSTTYCFAVWYGDVDPVFPYISASGDRRPVSCFFSMMVNLCSALSMLIIYLRYLLIVELNRDVDLLLKRSNILALFVGLLGAFGMFMVANFQESAVVVVHIVSAFICFGFGCIYMVLHSYITIRMYPLYTNRPIGFIRSSIATMAVACFITTVCFGVMAANEFHRFFPDLPTPRPWSEKLHQPGYELHCISAVAEWSLAVCNVAFFLSYSRDFEKIHVELDLRTLVSHLDESPLNLSYANIGTLY